MSDVQSGSLLAASHKYGVSDNAIRNWIRWYEDQSDDERGPSDQGVPAARTQHEPGAVRSDEELAADRMRLAVAPTAGSPTISP
jgi:transposase-like protein